MDTARLFQSGNSQAIRLPKKYRLPGSTVYLKRLGKAIIVLPEDSAWQPMLESLSEFDDDFMVERNQPPVQERAELKR
jgi:antitoxin VapB